MKQIEKICVFACIHGNEKFGLKILSRLEQLEDTRLCLHIGNMEAVAKNVRFIESDLNRSFALAEKTKEARIADRINKHLNQADPDIILDLHSSSVDVGIAGIASQHNDLIHAAAQQLGMKNVVAMFKDVADLSLIGQFPEKSLCLEFGTGLRSDRLARDMAAKIVGLVEASPQAAGEIGRYEVARIVSKSEIHGIKFANFEFNETLGGYPFLMGENNYGDMAGFLARLSA